MASSWRSKKALSLWRSRFPIFRTRAWPLGRDEKSNVEVRKWEKFENFPSTPKDHVDVGTHLGILDLERAAKITGGKIFPSDGLGARLERALINFMLDTHTGEHGYTSLDPFYGQPRHVDGNGPASKV